MMQLSPGKRLKVAAVIMGGGAGTRLFPLTRDRAKPAVPIAGKYRLVDIPISNCINSDMRRIYLLTQYNSVSLHQHIQSSYQFSQFSRGYVRVLAAQQTPDSESWYEGTADAVRKSFRYFMDEKPDLIVILSGDQLYRMNFQEIIQEHLDRSADVTIATKPVPRQEAGSLGLMEVDSAQRIMKIVEKPGDTPALDALRSLQYEEERYLGSMGIYVFKTSVLEELLQDLEASDFAKHLIPAAIERYRVFSYIFEGYWKDIGTIRSFWEANLALTEVEPEFSLYDAHAPIYTHMRFLPPSKINCCDLNRCLLSEGCIISGHRLLHAIIGVRAYVGEGSVIEHSVIMGNDHYEESPPPGLPAMGVGRECYIKNAIIDRDVRIGDGSYITPEGKPPNETTDLYTIRDGVMVIAKHTVIPAGTRL